MNIALIIVGGLTAMTLIAAGFDYLGNRSKRASDEVRSRLIELETRVRELEVDRAEKDGEIGALAEKLEFVGRLLEDKSRPGDPGKAG